MYRSVRHSGGASRKLRCVAFLNFLYCCVGVGVFPVQDVFLNKRYTTRSPLTTSRVTSVVTLFDSLPPSVVMKGITCDPSLISSGLTTRTASTSVGMGDLDTPSAPIPSGDGGNAHDYHQASAVTHLLFVQPYLCQQILKCLYCF